MTDTSIYVSVIWVCVYVEERVRQNGVCLAEVTPSDSLVSIKQV